MAVNKTIINRTLLAGTAILATWGLFAIADQSVSTEGKIPLQPVTENTGQWHKPDDTVLKKMLTPEQYNVTQ